MEQQRGLTEGLAACLGTVVHWWIQVAYGSCHLLTPLGWAASGGKHIADFCDYNANSLNKSDGTNQYVGDPWKRRLRAMQIRQILWFWMHSWRSEAEKQPNSSSSWVDLSQGCGRIHQGSSALDLYLMWKCFFSLSATSLFYPCCNYPSAFFTFTQYQSLITKWSSLVSNIHTDVITEDILSQALILQILLLNKEE